MNFIRSLIPQSWFEWLVYAATTVLAILKLTGVLDWSWIWILAPVWASFATFALLGCFTALKISWPMHSEMRKGKREEKKRLKR